MIRTSQKWFILLLCFCYPLWVSAQDNHKVFSSYNGESSISAPLSVTLKPGFYIPPPAPGTSVRIFTTGQSYTDCIPFVSQASTTQNYISTRTFKQAGMDPNNLGGRTACEVNEVIQYFDGLGRPLQTVQVQGSPGHNDIVKPVAYDAFGRERFRYQPYSVGGVPGSYRPQAVTDQSGFYLDQPVGGSIANNGHAFSETVFEASPLNRVLQQGAPGLSWQPQAGNEAGHTVKSGYGTNSAVDGVLLWVVNPNGEGATASGHYLPGKLYKATLRDENWQPGDDNKGMAEEYKDFDGRVVLKKVWATENKHLDTYYVYDDLGNLRYVLPPAVNANTDRGSVVSSFTEGDAAFQDFMYGYHYDGRNRVVEKKLPGKGWEFMVYNPLDQLVYTQDAVQRSNHQWLFNKYDALGRIVVTGISSDGNSRISIQAAVNNQPTTGQPLWESRDTYATNGIGYTNLTLPTSIASYHTVSYYDDYAFPGNIFGLPVSGQASGGRTKGLPTGTSVTTLGTGTMLLSVNYYDLEGRVVQTKSQHPLGTDVVDNSWNFAGELTASVRTHVGKGNTTTVANRYEYDHMGRKLATFEKINQDGEVALSHFEYDGIGQLKVKHLHNDQQHTSFAYNERGWLKGIRSNEFSMELKYDVAVNGVSNQFNGNIANQVFNNGNGDNTFNYSYDKLNRLTVGEVSSTLLSERLSYDVMGNIKTLSRDGSGDHQYHYIGNKLNYAEQMTNGYGYDVNGNTTLDGRNGMALTYNHLNLPETAGKAGMSLVYSYDATGKKLSKNANGSIRNYIDGIAYKPDNTIDFIHTEEGIARNSGGSYVYEYNLTDHLGNVRYSFNQNGTKLQSDDYYAFGKRKTPAFLSSTDNKYLYNGKELQEELDGQYDYGARFYDPVIGRWNVVDPLAETSRRFSPYVYGNNNPIRFIDPDGMASMPFDDYVFDQNGNFKRVDENNKPDKLVMEFVDDRKDMTITTKVYYNFNDPKTDVQAIKNGAITHVEIMGDEKVDRQINNSGVKDVNSGPQDYAKDQATKKMDYGVRGQETGDLASNTFYVREGTAYNIGDIGNYLWGRGMSELGIGLGTAKTGAHYNNIVNGRDQKTSSYDFGPGTYGGPGFWDSPADQRAISNGYNNNKNPTVRKINWAELFRNPK